MLDRARRLIEGYVAEESRTFPVNGQWLIDRCVPEGPSRGRLFSELKRYWDSMQSPDVGPFLDYAEDYVKRYIADLGPR